MGNDQRPAGGEGNKPGRSLLNLLPGPGEDEANAPTGSVRGAADQRGPAVEDR
jgi:hypothetical protein